jgi:sporulation protein YlmC with PRC-barrel domain
MYVITDKGLRLGKLQDIVFDESSGRLLKLVINPIVKEILDSLPKDEHGNSLISFSAVNDVSDCIVINEQILTGT